MKRMCPISRRRFVAAIASTGFISFAHADEADALALAREGLDAWIGAYQQRDYVQQWRLTDPRIRRWFGRERWRQRMRQARQRNGELTHCERTGQSLAGAGDLPCTEQRHCFREGVRYALFLLHTEYERAAPGQPEFAVMALSDEGWRFGGGTILNRPLGETAVIMTESDERRYEPDLSALR